MKQCSPVREALTMLADGHPETVSGLPSIDGMRASSPRGSRRARVVDPRSEMKTTELATQPPQSLDLHFQQGPSRGTVTARQLWADCTNLR